MVKLVNRAKMFTATTGTGTIALGSTVDGFQNFTDAGVVDGDVVRYAIEEVGNFEIGTGVFDATAGTLTRNPSESSSAGSAINLLGDATVFITAAGQDIVQLDETQTLTNKTIDAEQNNITNVSKTFNVTVRGSNDTSDWAGSDPFIATLTVSGIKATDRPIVDIDLSTVGFVNVQNVQNDWLQVYRVEASANDEIKLYALAEPVENFDLLIKVVG